MEISKNDHYRALSILKDEDLELNLKREPNSCFAINCFDFALKTWQPNIDIQPAFNEYKAVTLNIDHYKERPSTIFFNRKYSILDDFCYVEFLAYYTLEIKSSKTVEYQPDELDDNLIENNH